MVAMNWDPRLSSGCHLLARDTRITVGEPPRSMTSAIMVGLTTPCTWSVMSVVSYRGRLY